MLGEKRWKREREGLKVQLRARARWQVAATGERCDAGKTRDTSKCRVGRTTNTDQCPSLVQKAYTQTCEGSRRFSASVPLRSRSSSYEAQTKSRKRFWMVGAAYWGVAYCMFGGSSSGSEAAWRCRGASGRSTGTGAPQKCQSRRERSGAARRSLS